MKKKILTGVGVLVLVGAAAFIGKTLIDAFPQQQQTPSENQQPAPNAQQYPAGQQGGELGVYREVKTDADLLEALDYEVGMNSDTIGWIQVPGTDINNSVLQGHDNTVYLKMNERRKPDMYGAYALDYECNVGTREVMSPNTVIYGHSDLKDNPDGPRFSQLFRFTDKTFAHQTPYIRFSTSEEFMDWQVFAVFYPNVSMNYIKVNMTGDELVKLAQAAMEQSIYDYGIKVGPNDKIITLSTCTMEYGVNDVSHRFVIMAKLAGKNEEKSPTAMFEINEENVPESLKEQWQQKK